MSARRHHGCPTSPPFPSPCLCSGGPGATCQHCTHPPSPTERNLSPKAHCLLPPQPSKRLWVLGAQEAQGRFGSEMTHRQGSARLSGRQHVGRALPDLPHATTGRRGCTWLPCRRLLPQVALAGEFSQWARTLLRLFISYTDGNFAFLHPCGTKSQEVCFTI